MPLGHILFHQTAEDKIMKKLVAFLFIALLSLPLPAMAQSSARASRSREVRTGDTYEGVIQMVIVEGNDSFSKTAEPGPSQFMYLFESEQLPKKQVTLPNQKGQSQTYWVSEPVVLNTESLVLQAQVRGFSRFEDFTEKILNRNIKISIMENLVAGNFDVYSINLDETQTVNNTSAKRKVPVGMFEASPEDKMWQYGVESFLVSAPPAEGMRKELVMPIQLTDATLPVAPAVLYSRLFTLPNSVSGYFAKYSGLDSDGGSRLRITGDITPVLSVNLTKAECLANQISTCSTLALAAAQAAGFVPTNYEFYTFIFPELGGGSVAFASVGPKGGATFPLKTWIQLNPSLATETSFIRTVIHETGHKLGLQHYDSSTMAGVVNDGFGNIDHMTAFLRSPSLFHQLVLGWTPKVTTLTGRQTYVVRISPLSSFGKNSKGILIPSYDTSDALTGRMTIVEAVRSSGPYNNYVFPYLAYEYGSVAISDGATDLSIVNARAKQWRVDLANQSDMTTAVLSTRGQSITLPDSGVTVTLLEKSIILGSVVMVTLSRGPQAVPN